MGLGHVYALMLSPLLETVRPWLSCAGNATEAGISALAKDSHWALLALGNAIVACGSASLCLGIGLLAGRYSCESKAVISDEVRCHLKPTQSLKHQAQMHSRILSARDRELDQL